MARLPPDGLLSHVSVWDGALYSLICARSKEIRAFSGSWRPTSRWNSTIAGH